MNLKKKLKLFLYFLGIFFVILIFVIFLPIKKNSEQTRVQKYAHFYQDPTISLHKIHLKVFYVIPKNKVAEAYLEWEDATEQILEEMKTFHAVQFGKASELAYSIYPIPIFLREGSLFYDTLNTNRGNPAGLFALSDEIHRRVLNSSGDLYNSQFSEFPDNTFPVLGIIYEGVGASGTKGELLLSRTFLTREEYLPFSASLFYHEFGHTMGFPDLYDIGTGAPVSDDIMGLGRQRPLEHTFIAPDLLMGAGL